MADKIGGAIGAGMRAYLQGGQGPSAFPALPEAPPCPEYTFGPQGYANEVRLIEDSAKFKRELEAWRTGAMRIVLVRSGHYTEGALRGLDARALERCMRDKGLEVPPEMHIPKPKDHLGVVALEAMRSRLPFPWRRGLSDWASRMDAQIARAPSPK